MSTEASRTVRLNVVVAVAYFAVGYGTLVLGETAGVELRQVIWAGSGIALAIGLVFPWPVWPGVAAAAALTTALTGGAPIHILGTAVANGFEVGATVMLLRRAGFDTRLERVRDVLLLVGVAALVALATSFLSSATLTASGGAPFSAFGRIWLLWWVTHGVGILAITPAGLMLGKWSDGAARAGRLEFGGVLGLIAVVGVVTFLAPHGSVIADSFYLTFPLLVWAAIRLGPAGSAFGASIITSAAILAVVLESGPLVGTTESEGRLLTWSFANSVILTALVVGALLAQRERARFQVADGERRLRAVMDATTDGILVSDEKGNITDANPALRRIIGEDVSVQPGRPVAAALAQVRQRAELLGGRAADVLDADAEAGDAHGLIDLHDHTIEATTAPLSAGGVPGRIWTLRDITDRVHSEEERRSLERQVLHAQKLEGLGVLAGGIAHDFNNLLTVILGHAEFLADTPDLGDDAQQNAAQIIETTTQAAHLCQQMLAYAGMETFSVGPFDLSAAAREIGDLLRVSVSRRVALSLELSPQPIVVDGDSTQLRQVVMNLVTNASEAAAARGGGGRVSLSTGVEHVDQAWLNRAVLDDGLSPGEYAFIAVSDNGPGIDAEALGRIFDPFFSSKGAGRGLGLAATLGVIRSHGGALSVQSEAGEGSRFRVILPLSQSELPGAAGSLPASEPESATGAHVLLVDDEAAVRRVARRILEQSGYEVTEAEHGGEALAIMDREGDNVDVVVLDLTMPVLSGPETLAEMRKRGHAVPVIVASGYSRHEISGDHVVAAFVQKPYRAEGFQDVVAQVLNAVRGSRRS